MTRWLALWVDLNMMLQSTLVAVVAVVMADVPSTDSEAQVLKTNFATLIHQGAQYTASDDYIVVSTYFALSVLIWAVFFPVLAAYLGYRLYKSANLGIHLISNIGMAAIGLPPSLTIVADKLGFLKVDGRLDGSSALIACTSVICITLYNAVRHVFPYQNLSWFVRQPLVASSVDSGSSNLVRTQNSLQQMIVEKLVEEGMPSAEAVAKYIIETVGPIPGEDAFEELPARLRSHVFNQIVNEHDIDSIRDATPNGVTLRKVVVSRLVNRCRSSSRNRMNSFLSQLDLFRGQLSIYRDRANLNEQSNP